jgi:hypothetical protein
VLPAPAESFNNWEAPTRFRSRVSPVMR